MKNKLISDKVIETLQFRIQQEKQSSYLYEQMHLWLNNIGMTKSASLWKKYSEEELKHAQWSADYLMSFDVLPELRDLEAPISTFKDLQDVVQQTYDHEVDVSQQCLKLAETAMKESDFMLFTLAQKYNAEQVEEMDKVNTLLDFMKLSSDMLVIDTYIGENLL